MADGGLYGYASLFIGGAVAMGVAWVSRVPRAELEPDMTTIEGLARVVTEQGKTITMQGDKIAVLEQRNREHTEHSALQDRTIRALRRWALALETALRGTGADVPDPEPEDAPLISG